jgi:pSer/pThr/pTyr-binding forkhead associated (FHA) protein
MIITVKLMTGETLDFPLEENRAVVGRSPKCEVVIKHDGLSRQHCLIEATDGDVYVTDLDSTNGVLINGAKIPPSTRTLLPTFLPISFGPIEALTVQLDLTQSRILQSSQTKFFKFDKSDDGLTKTTKQTSKLERPKVNPVRLPPKSKQNSKTLLMNILIVVVLMGAAIWFTKKKSAPEEKKAIKLEQQKAINSDYF